MDLTTNTYIAAVCTVTHLDSWFGGCTVLQTKKDLTLPSLFKTVLDSYMFLPRIYEDRNKSPEISAQEQKNSLLLIANKKLSVWEYCNAA